MVTCRDCRQPYPQDSLPHLCPNCGGLFGFSKGITYSTEKVESGLPGIWRQRHSFSLPNGAPLITLGEGDTPLIWSQVFGKKVGFKLESLNPTGSFKDRGTAVLVSWLVAAGVKEAVEDSSGNAGSSFAAYAARSGIKARIFIPSYASGPKRSQIESYGADVIAVPGSRTKAAEAVLQEVEEGAIYASHAFLPQGTAGIATIAYELVQQIDGIPGTILLPVGHGSLLLGIALGFQALRQSGLIQRIPKIIGIQAAKCAPLFNAYENQHKEPASTVEGKTIAEGVQISTPYHGKNVLRVVKESGGSFVAVGEQEIVAGQQQLAKLGIHVELTSALVWNALEQIHQKSPEPIVCILTGHGLKGV
ncbi:MAG: threonine synthase [Anaerolineales bacterium]|nr:threonine synthase [Anaerolineales bacterium]